MTVLACLEWLLTDEVGFGLTGTAWNGGIKSGLATSCINLRINLSHSVNLGKRKAKKTRLKFLISHNPRGNTVITLKSKSVSHIYRQFSISYLKAIQYLTMISLMCHITLLSHLKYIQYLTLKDNSVSYTDQFDVSHDPIEPL
jgi:hypothetical protein